MEARYYDLVDGKIAMDKFRDRLDGCTAVLINSPSNPTGVSYDEEELAELAEVLLEYPHIIIATDDIYEHILWGQDRFRNQLRCARAEYVYAKQAVGARIGNHLDRCLVVLAFSARICAANCPVDCKQNKCYPSQPFYHCLTPYENSCHTRDLWTTSEIFNPPERIVSSVIFA